MNDLISRQAAIDIVVFECGEWTGLAKEISKQLNQLPSAEKTDTNHYRVVDASYSPYTIDSTTKSYSITIPKMRFATKKNKKVLITL